MEEEALDYDLTVKPLSLVYKEINTHLLHNLFKKHVCVSFVF